MAAKRAKRSSVRLWGAPEPENFRKNEPGRSLAQAARFHFDSKREQDKLLALEKLALDVFNNPLAARAFAVNPEEYLTRAGFPNVRLDLNSPEVRIAMALGDPSAKEAARRGDANAFLKIMMAQGLSPKIGTPMALFGVELAVWFTAVAVSWVAAAYTVETAVSVHHKIGVFGVKLLTVDNHLEILVRAAERLGDKKFAQRVRSRATRNIIEKYVALHRSARGLPDENG